MSALRGCLVKAATKRCAQLSSSSKPSLTFSPQISVVHETHSPFDYDRSSFVPVTYSCDKCGATILTFRYHCKKHKDYDVCHSCFVSKTKLCGCPRAGFEQFDPDDEDEDEASGPHDPTVKLTFGESPGSSPASDNGAGGAESRPKKRRRPKKLNRGARKHEERKHEEMKQAAKKRKANPKS